MPKVSPSPSVHFDYKKEDPVNENDPSSTNNLWLYRLQFVAITILCVLVLAARIAAGKALMGTFYK